MTTTQTQYTLCVRHYFDKANGNSYYSMRIVGAPDGDIIVPMDYGHGDLTYKVEACKRLGIDWASMEWEQRTDLFTLDVTTVSKAHQLHTVNN